jgi:hypothetical protein
MADKTSQGEKSGQKNRYRKCLNQPFRCSPEEVFCTNQKGSSHVDPFDALVK